MKFLTHVLLISSLVLSASVAGAQNPQNPKPVNRPSPEQDVDTLKIDTNLVTVPVIASSRTGSYIADLKKEEFKLTEDGVARKAISCATPSSVSLNSSFFRSAM